MIRNIMNKKSKKKGFTLIELIIVIAILAILAAVAIPKFMEVRNNANVKSDIANAKNLHTIAASLVADNDLTTGQYVVGNGTLSTGAQAIADKLDSTAVAKASANKGKFFAVDVDTNSNISIYLANSASDTTGVAVYPNGAGDYAAK